MLTVDYLDALQDHFGVSSDYALKDLTGWSKSTISNYRNGKQFFCDDHAEQVADWLGIHRGAVLGDVHAERSKNTNTRDTWRQIAEHFRGMTIAVLVALGLTAGLFSPARSDAAPVPHNQGSVYYVKLWRSSISWLGVCVRRCIAWVFPWATPYTLA